MIFLLVIHALAAAGGDIGLVPLLFGGGGLIGIGGLATTLYMLRANKDDLIARAAKTLVEGQLADAEHRTEDLNAARAEIRTLTEKVEELTVEVRAARQDAHDARAEADEARAREAAANARCEDIAAQLAGRRRTDPTPEPA